LRIVLDIDFDQSSFPGPLGDKQAVINEAWVGPIGLTDILETQLGLSGAYLSNAERALRLVNIMQKKDGFYSRSAQVDPFGSALRLLQWRDELKLSGWNGRAKSPRLAQLAELTKDVAPGSPDRLAAIEKTLAGRKTAIEEVVIFESEQQFSPLLKKVLAALEKQGTQKIIRELGPAKATGDLAACREAGFEPRGDGSLQLLRTAGHVEAAEEAAAWLASLGKDCTALVVRPDPVLDAALYRHGLPTLGATTDSQRNSLLSALPLILELAYAPKDPQAAFELLHLPISPVRPSLARELIKAMHNWPAVHGQAWEKATQAGLEKIKDAAERNRVGKRIEGIFSGELARSARYPAKEITRRVSLLEDWLRGYEKYNPELEDQLEALTRQCSVLTSMLAACKMPDFSAFELGFLVDQATRAPKLDSTHKAQAGLGSLEQPGSLAGPVDYLLIWDFCLSKFVKPGGIPLSAAEWREMKQSGVAVVEPAEQALLAASRWRRPFMLTRKALVCVCPMRTADGAEEFPHPAWDEIRSRAAEGLAERLTTSRVIPPAPIKRKKSTLRPLAGPTEVFSIVSGSLSPREVESPSSLGELLQCPLRYGLHYPARIRPGVSWPLAKASDALILGSLAHELLADVLGQIKDPSAYPLEKAQKKIEQAFDSKAPAMAADLFMPGNEDLRSNLKNRLDQVLREVFQLCKRGGYKIAAVEERVEAEALGTKLGGYIDLLLSGPKVVIDFKWSGAGGRKDELSSGSALQLAIYSHLVRDKGRKDYPGVAYLIIKGPKLLAADDLPGAEIINGPGPKKTWAALEKSYQELWAAIASGKLAAAGVGDQAIKKSGIKDGFLRLKAKCEWCDYGALCGRMFEVS
jgi:ATP-dependent helicase/nuclease subunit B